MYGASASADRSRVNPSQPRSTAALTCGGCTVGHHCPRGGHCARGSAGDAARQERLRLQRLCDHRTLDDSLANCLRIQINYNILHVRLECNCRRANVCPPVSVSTSVSVSVSPSLTDTHTHTLSLSLSLPPSLFLSLSLSLAFSLSLFLSFFLALSLSLFLVRVQPVSETGRLASFNSPRNRVLHVRLENEMAFRFG